MQRTGRLLRHGFSATVMTVLSLAGGGCESPTSPSSAASLAGTWTGTSSMTQTTFVRNANGSYTSSTSTPTATLSLVIAKQNSEITKSGVALSGTWTMTFADPANNRNGSLSLTAYMAEDCTYAGTVKFCKDSYTTREIRNLLLPSSRACSTFYAFQGGVAAGGNTISLPNLQNEFNGGDRDPTCSGNYARLAGTFTVTKQ